jgi:hypothetical protein
VGDGTFLDAHQNLPIDRLLGVEKEYVVLFGGGKIFLGLLLSHDQRTVGERSSVNKEDPYSPKN